MRPGQGKPQRPFGYRVRLPGAIAPRRRLALAGAAAIMLVAVGLAVGGASAAVWNALFAGMPATPAADSLWALGREPSVEVLARDGTLIGRRGPSYARRAPVAEMPPHLISAFLAAEDRRFFLHPGVDWRALTRAALANWRAGETTQGGSTITQQLVKNLIVGPERTLRRKAQEMRLALALERRVSKQEILDLYLNRVYLGERAYGVEAASLRYFGHSARQATLAQSALLAALPKAPTRLSPQDNLAAARERAALVLTRMADAGFITAEARDYAIANPAQLAVTPDTPPPPVFGYAFDEAVRQARALGVDAPDLVIHTTLDPAMQQAAGRALSAMLDSDGRAARASQGAIVALDYSGAVLALTGGRDYLASPFNRATQARRQPGSAFKVFVFATALESGLRPATVRNDAPLTIGDWSPRNYEGGYRGRVTLREAFYRSINTVAARLTQEAGAQTVAGMARRMGVETPLAALPSLALGSSEVTLMELTGAYGVFARDGELRPPFLVTAVTDTGGASLYRRPETPATHVYEASLARQMTGMMHDVVARGTGAAAALGDRDAAGKTGTSQSHRDAWFVGYSGDLIAGVWLGNDDNSPMRNVTGGRLPARLWRDFMTRAEAERPARPLNLPEERTDGRNAQRAALYAELQAAFARAATD